MKKIILLLVIILVILFFFYFLKGKQETTQSQSLIQTEEQAQKADELLKIWEIEEGKCGKC